MTLNDEPAWHRDSQSHDGRNRQKSTYHGAGVIHVPRTFASRTIPSSYYRLAAVRPLLQWSMPHLPPRRLTADPYSAVPPLYTHLTFCSTEFALMSEPSRRVPRSGLTGPEDQPESACRRTAAPTMPHPPCRSSRRPISCLPSVAAAPPYRRPLTVPCRLYTHTLLSARPSLC